MESKTFLRFRHKEHQRTISEASSRGGSWSLTTLLKATSLDHADSLSKETTADLAQRVALPFRTLCSFDSSDSKFHLLGMLLGLFIVSLNQWFFRAAYLAPYQWVGGFSQELAGHNLFVPVEELSMGKRQWNMSAKWSQHGAILEHIGKTTVHFPTYQEVFGLHEVEFIASGPAAVVRFDCSSFCEI